MRTIAVIVFVVVATASCVDIVSPRTELRPFADVLCEEIYRADLLTYTDGLFGYSASYPACFRRDRNEPSFGRGRARFCHDSWTNIALECYVTRAVGPDNAAVCDIRRMGRMLRARAKPAGGGAYILSGPLYEGGTRIDGYGHYTKCVRTGKLWFCYALSYPEEYRDSLGRLFALIDHWQPWAKPAQIRRRTA